MQLDEWEASDINLCWLAIWMAYREKGKMESLVTPVLAGEWSDLRRWARSFVKRHSPHKATNPYNGLVKVPMEHIHQIVHYLDAPIGQGTDWPHDTDPPCTIPDKAAAIAALAPRLDRIGSMP